jgi:D-glycero-D-manno-heptose 1,7-bisphosphate phosphatase
VKPAVFIDRDGTILDELGYLTPASTIHLYPYSIDAIRLLGRAGYSVIVITNQGGIGLGMYDSAFVDRTHAMLAEQFQAGGARVDGWYYCPHHPDAVVPEFKRICECRKPATGLVTAAARDLNLDLGRSWVIGDQWRDIEVARRTGARGILVRTGYGRGLEANWPKDIALPTLISDNLMSAAAHILGSPAASAANNATRAKADAAGEVPSASASETATARPRRSSPVSNASEGRPKLANDTARAKDDSK